MSRGVTRQLSAEPGAIGRETRSKNGLQLVPFDKATLIFIEQHKGKLRTLCTGGLREHGKTQHELLQFDALAAVAIKNFEQPPHQWCVFSSDNGEHFLVVNCSRGIRVGLIELGKHLIQPHWLQSTELVLQRLQQVQFLLLVQGSITQVWITLSWVYS